MNINEILTEMKIEHKCLGNTEFETLGLTDYAYGSSVCTFITDAKYAKNLKPDTAVALITDDMADRLSCRGLCIVDDPRKTFFTMHNFLADRAEYKRPSEPSKIGNNCRISPLAYIAEQNVVIGDNAVIEEFVSIKENTVIGNNCIIRAGSILGGEGFEFKRDDNDNLFGVRHTGGVILCDNVEIQQSTCVDRAVYPWDNTVIGEYSKVDNLVHIAHGVKIGRNTMVVANSGIGGRVVIGDNCWMGFGVTIRNGIKIGNDARANMGAVVSRNVNDGASVTGNFAIDHQIFLKNLKNSVRGNENEE